jgi:hypothetical protein
MNFQENEDTKNTKDEEENRRREGKKYGWG